MTRVNSINIQVPIELDFKKQLTLKSSYKELIYFIHQQGPAYHVEFRLKLTPTNNRFIAISIIDLANNTNSNSKEITKIGIIDGITEFVNQLNKRGIGISGMNIEIENLSYSVVDSKPRGFSIMLLECLNRIEKTNIFKYDIIEQERISNFYKTQTFRKEILFNEYQLGTTHFTIPIARTHKQTIKLTKNVRIEIKDDNNEYTVFILKLSPSIQNRKPYIWRFELCDSLEFLKESKKTQLVFLFYEHLQCILHSYRSNGYNVAGINIKMELQSDIDYLNNNKLNLEFAKWPILDILNEKDSIEIIQENL